MIKKLRVGLVGHGYLGKWHAQKIVDLEQSELSCIVERNETLHSTLKNQYKSTRLFKNVKDALEFAEAFIISTPTESHFEIAKYLIENEKHVFCEKPVTQTSSEAFVLKKLAETKKLFFK